MVACEKPLVGIVMGSDSDWPAVSKAAATLESFGVPYEARVISAHRTPEVAAEVAAGAEENGFEAVICAAGKAAHLAGVIAAHTVLPVIGIPMKTSDLGGMDSLLSTVQMPKGVPVATVAIGGAENAALLAIQIMGGAHPDLREAFRAYKVKMDEDIKALDAEMNA